MYHRRSDYSHVRALDLSQINRDCLTRQLRSSAAGQPFER